MGIPFEPPMEMMAQAMQMVAQNADDPLTAPLNMLPLQAMFASGSPDMINDPRDFDPLDMERLRLDPSTFDETVRVRARAETMFKMSQLAHNFATKSLASPPTTSALCNGSLASWSTCSPRSKANTPWKIC